MKHRHTPAPWHLDTSAVNPITIHWSGGCVATCTLPLPHGKDGYTWIGHTVYESEANAAFIVRAVNSHEQLLEALRECRKALNHHGITGDPASAMADAAIAAAELRA